MIFNDLKIEDYCIQMSSDIPDYLLELEKETNLSTTMPQMLSGRLQGRILSFISRLNNPGKILELGTFTGYSALCLAEGLVENGRLITVELDREFDRIIKKYIDKSLYKENIEVVYGDALEFMKTLNEAFDIIFIDAYKQDYILYYEQAVRLLRKGGLIITDNVLWSGKVIFEIDDKTALALNEFNKHVKGDKRVEKIMIPVRDGITLIMKK